MKKVFIVKIFIIALSAINLACARDNIRTVSSTDFFYRILAPSVESQLALTAVLFYASDQVTIPKGVSKEEREQARKYKIQIKKRIKEQLEEFKSAARALQEVTFLVVDLAKRDTQQLEKTYNINSYPEIRLFKNGRQIKENKLTISLKGDFTQDQLLEEPEILQFVQKYFGKDISTIIKAKAEMKFELAKASASAPRVYGSYWGWGGPYWGGYWGGPYWGAGWGWGYGGYGCGRCGW